MDAKTTYRPCPACETTAATEIAAYSPDPWKVVRCETCGFVYLRNPPGYAALVEEFAWEVTTTKKVAKGGSTALSGANRALREKVALPDGSHHVARIAKIFGSGRVLDIGCGYGRQLAPPLVPYGIEISEELHAIADAAMRARGGYCLHAAGAEGIWQFEAEMFDGILMHSYLEHESDVLGVLKGAARALKPGGKIYVRVPNFASLNRRLIGAKWCGFRYPDHVNYFTIASLRDVAQRAGLGIRLKNRINLWVDDNIKALLTKNVAA